MPYASRRLIVAAAALAVTRALPARTFAQSAPVTGAYRSPYVFFGYAR